MPSRFVLHTFGGLALSARAGGAPALVNQRKRLALMAALGGGANGGVARERLFAMFWPEANGERARNGLNQVVFAVRRDLGDDAILTDTLSLRLNPAVVDSDLRVFREALADGRFADAIDTYRGPFLDGVFLRETPEFERWASELRHALAVDYAHALEREIDAASNALPARADDAVRYGRLLAVHDPLSTKSALRLMRALEQGNDAAAALRHAAVHAAHVRAELESEPGPELEREVARLRANGGNGTPVADPASAERSNGASVAQAIAPAKAMLSERNTRRSRLWVAVGAAVVVATVSIALFETTKFRHVQAAAGAPDSSHVLVAAFTNRTGDSTLDYIGYIAADWITQGLSQSEIVKVVYGPTAFELSRTAPGGASASDTDRVRLLSMRSGAGTLVHGSYYLVHDSIVFSAEVTDGRSGRVLRSIPSIAASKSDPRRGVQLLRERSVGALATVLEPRLASLSGLSSPPPLMEAYRAYLDGLDSVRRGAKPGASMARFIFAARQDSTFVLPALWAVRMAGYARDQRVLDSLLQVLEAHRSQLALIDRYALDFEKIVRDSSLPPQRRLEAVGRIVKLAPASNYAWIQAGYLFSAGYGRQALEALERIDPEHGWAGPWSQYWIHLSRVQHGLGEYAAQRRTAERAKALGAPSDGWVEATTMEALIGLGFTDSLMALVRDRSSTWTEDERGETWQFLAAEIRAHGPRALADSLTRVALDWYRSRTRNSPALSGPALTVFRFTYLDFSLTVGAFQDAKVVAEAIMLDGLGMEGDRNEYLYRAHGALAAVAASNGDRARALAEIAQMPDLAGRHRQIRWSSARLKAIVAGTLHDRELAIKYLAEMESQGVQANSDAVMVVNHSPALKWLSGDPRLRLPYVGSAP